MNDIFDYIMDAGIIIGFIVLFIIMIYLGFQVGTGIYEYFSGTKEICLGGHYELRQVHYGKTFVLKNIFVCDSAKIIY